LPYRITEGLPVIRPRSTVGSKQRLWTNLTTDHPDDWDVAVGILFPNYAALHYGSRDAMIDARKKRNELREVVASKLAREMLPK
jgi:ethanolamine ammonia-lyase large subunit